jgi:hypothetical protein
MRVLATAMAVLLWPAFASADSLGSAARKQAQRREKPRAAEVKVYGDGDLAARSVASADVPAAESEPSPTPAAASGAAAAAREPEDAVSRALEREERARRQQETHWRQAAAVCRARVAIAQRNYDYVCAGGTLLTGG